MSLRSIQRQPSNSFNSTLYDLDFQVPKTNKLQKLSDSRTWNKFNPSQQCTLSLLEISRLRSFYSDSDKSLSDSSITDNQRTPISTQKYLLQFEEDLDDEIVMFEVQ